MALEKTGPALVTGASSGIGEAFAKSLAASGFDLILVARSGEKLERIAADLRERHSIRAEALPADLADDTSLKRVETRIEEISDLALLVNSAGFGLRGKFPEVDIEKTMALLKVHVEACVRLCRAALPGMISRGRGAIVNVSSLGAMIKLPENVAYCATKAFVNTFSETLQIELQGTGVKVQALCPSFTRTGFHRTEEYKDLDLSLVPEFMWMSAEEVAEYSLRALAKDRVVVVPGTINRLLTVLKGPLYFWSLRRRR